MLKKLSDIELHTQLLKLVRDERETLTQVLSHLVEVQSRRLFSDYACRSLFEYCVKVLRYSESQAYRRINAMKLSREIPEVKDKIEEGKLTLTAISSAVKFFKSEKVCDKKKVLKKIENQSSKQVERTLAGLASAPISTMNQIEISGETKEVLDRIRGLLAHKNPQLSYDEIILKLTQSFSSAKKHPVIKRPLTLKDKCSICASTWALEVDHVRPRSFGGDNSPSNLRVLCRSCNQRQAIRKLGRLKMQSYLE